jgi:rfaE bifunctional protein nucleotidyltransferase chain/domain
MSECCTLQKLVSRGAAARWRKQLQAQGRTVAFTNGCFDLLHPGHVAYLEQARSLGDALIVGVNTDDSVQRLIKGPGRPVTPEADRARVLAALTCVDRVVLFPEDTPLELITVLQPDVLVKGGDYQLSEIVGREVVEARGGRVLALPFVEGYSTTELLRRIRSGK